MKQFKGVEVKELKYIKLTKEQKETVARDFYDRPMTEEEKTYRYAFDEEGRCHYAC